jgi:tetratricopeptide (TPR) repeat protein
MTRSVKIFAGVAMVLTALFTVIALTSVASYYVLGIREADQLLTEAYWADVTGNCDVAIAKYSAALRKPLSNQRKAQVLANRGHAYNSKRQFAKAIADHSQAIRLNPQLSYPFSARGYSYSEIGEFEKALNDLTESIRLDPNSDYAYYNRGLLFQRKGQFAEALKDFDEAVRCSPERADRLVTRALCYFKMNQTNRALASFDGAIATEPGNPLGYVARSNFYARNGNVDKQQRDYQQALRLDSNAEKLWIEVDGWFDNSQAEVDAQPKHTSQLDSLGLLTSVEQRFLPQQLLRRNAGKTYHQLFEEAKLAHEQGNYEDEIALWDDVVAVEISAIQVSPAIMNRGNAYAAKGEFERALRDYNESINLNPSNAGAYVNRALALAKQGDFEGALNDYGQAILLNPRQWEAYFNRAAELRDCGELREAVDDLGKVIEIKPEFVGAYMNRGNIYIRMGELDKAITDYNTALSREPNLADLYVARADIFLQKKDYRHALLDFQTAVQMKARPPERALNSLAWLRATCPQHEIRNGQEAVTLALKACELSKWKNCGIVDTLAAAYAEQGDFDRAIKYQKLVLQIGKSSNELDKMKEHLRLYETHTPYRDLAK